MDSIAKFNQERWAALAEADALFTRPWWNETKESALQRLDPLGLLGDVHGKDVLCLAGGGGQQSVAFALNGARVSVLDLSEEQLQRDEAAATHYRYQIATRQGDMRDLGVFGPNRFDIVYHPYSLNFVPDCCVVFAQVSQVLRPGGLYLFWAANPFAAGLGTHSWNGRAYEVCSSYKQGEEVRYEDEAWVFRTGELLVQKPSGPREYRQLLSTLINGLVQSGFGLLRMEEVRQTPADDPVAGGWDHFTAVLPPWFSFLARLERKKE